MPISFRCSHCGLEAQVEEKLAGQTGPCRQCGQSVTVPLLAEPVSDGRGGGCPRCGGRSLRGGSLLGLGVIGAMLVSPVVCNQCGHEYDARKPETDFRKRKLFLMLVINGIGAVGIAIVIGLLALEVYFLSR